AERNGTVADGTVLLKEGDRTLGSSALKDGRAEFSTDNLNAGPHNIRAFFGGNAAFAESNSEEVPHTVTPAETKLAFRLSDKVPVVGQPITVMMDVQTKAGATSGTITAWVGDTKLETVPLTGGSARLQIVLGAAGLHSLRATFT